MLATRKRSAARIGVFVLISPRPLVTLVVWLPSRVSRTTPGAPAATSALASCCRDVFAPVPLDVAAAEATTRTAAVRQARIAPESSIVLRRRDPIGLDWTYWVVPVMTVLRLIAAGSRRRAAERLDGRESDRAAPGDDLGGCAGSRDDRLRVCRLGNRRRQCDRALGRG